MKTFLGRLLNYVSVKNNDRTFHLHVLYKVIKIKFSLITNIKWKLETLIEDTLSQSTRY